MVGPHGCYIPACYGYHQAPRRSASPRSMAGLTCTRYREAPRISRPDGHLSPFSEMSGSTNPLIQRGRQMGPFVTSCYGFPDAVRQPSKAA